VREGATVDAREREKARESERKQERERERESEKNWCHILNEQLF